MNRAWLIALCLATFHCVLPILGCASSRPCPPSEPVYKWKEVKVPYPVVVTIPDLEELVLPEYPQHPGHDADDVELKAWALEVQRVASEREEIMLARIEAVTHLIRTHNMFEVVDEPDGPPVPHD